MKSEKQIEYNNKETIIQILEEYKHLYTYTTERFKELTDELSNLDLKLTDIDHYVVFNRVSGVTMSKLMKKRIELLTQRRKVKNELADITRIREYCGSPSKLENKLNQHSTYKYRTKIIQEILGE